jgi:hypothetical protein
MQSMSGRGAGIVALGTSPHRAVGQRPGSASRLCLLQRVKWLGSWALGLAHAVPTAQPSETAPDARTVAGGARSSDKFV